MHRVALIDADTTYARLLRRYLESEGFRVDCFQDARSGLSAVMSTGFDLMIVDMNLPDLGGIEMCRQLRTFPSRASLPVVFMCRQAGEDEIVEGLAAGADDVVPKGVHLREVAARIRAVLRRCAPNGNGATFQGADLIIYLDAMTVVRGTERIALSRGEAEILTILLRHAPGAVPVAQFIAELSFGAMTVTRGNIEARIKSLRRKIGREHIETRTGFGFAFVAGR